MPRTSTVEPIGNVRMIETEMDAGLAETLPLPYGFAPPIWQDILSQVTGLRDSIEGDADDEAIIDAATTLRTTLRQYV